MGAYGREWAKQIKEDLMDSATPTLREVVTGISEMLIAQMETKMNDMQEQRRLKINKSLIVSMEKFFESMGISDWDKPMIHDRVPELGLLNPYSKITYLIVYLYSMELGSPPLYAEANRVSRDMDLTQLKHLGPYVRALNGCVQNAEFSKNPDDRVATGQMNGGVPNNLSGSYLLYRGEPMQEE